MGKGIYIVPISNFLIESAFKVGDIIFSPSIKELIAMGDDAYTDTLSEEEFQLTKKCMYELNIAHSNILMNSTMAIIQRESIQMNSPQNSFLFVNQVCEIVDRAMDYFRLEYCQIGKFETLPGLAGISIDGFKQIFHYNDKTNEITMLPGEVTLLIRDGIGLMPSQEPTKRLQQDSLFVCIFNNRTDEVFNTCREALRRVNEAMYMHNLNTAFIYLMSTIEMLASSEYIQFKKVKPKILPFIADSDTDYHKLSKYLTDLSQNKRTEIVHNAKSLYDLYSSLDEIRCVLFKMTGIIVRYVEKVVSLNINTIEELEVERESLMDKIGI